MAVVAVEQGLLLLQPWAVAEVGLLAWRQIEVCLQCARCLICCIFDDHYARMNRMVDDRTVQMSAQG